MDTGTGLAAYGSGPRRAAGRHARPGCARDRRGLRHAPLLAMQAVLVLAGMSAAMGAAAQSSDSAANGMIVIPGNGESAEAALANATRATSRAAGANAPAAPVTGTWQSASQSGAWPAPGIGAAQRNESTAPVPSATAWGRGSGGAGAPVDAQYVRSVQADTPGAAQTAASAPAARSMSYAPGYAGYASNPGNAGYPRRAAHAAMPTPPAASFAAAPTAGSAAAQANAGFAKEDGDIIRRTATAFLQQQTLGLPGKVTIAVAQPFARGLAVCGTLEPFQPAGARLWGRTTVGVRCAGEHPWTVYLQAKIAIEATYYVAARQIAPGEALGAADLTARDGDLTVLPQAVITDPAQAVGAFALARIGAGLPLRTDMLRSAAAVTAGTTVRVIANGAGFSISTAGSALANAAPGQAVRVKTESGQIVTAVVKDAGTVEIPL